MVVRIKPYHGIFTLTRGDQCLLRCEVGISYDAPFGPDAEDIIEWRRLGIAGADADYERRGEAPPR